METFDNISTFEDAQLFDTLLDDEMCSELYNGQFDGSHSQYWLDCLMKDTDDDSMLMSGVGSSLNLGSPLVNSEHSYSLAADYSHSAPTVKTELDNYVDCDLDVMNAVNPNLAMTNCLLETERDHNAAEVYCDELNQTDDLTPEIYIWDENDIQESEPVESSDEGESVQLSVATSPQSEHISPVSSPSQTAIVVTHSTKLLRQQPTIIVTHARHPTSCSTSPVVAQVSKAGILSKIKPATVTIDGSAGLVFKNNTVVVSSLENCMFTGSDDVEELPPTPPGSCSGDSEESRSPKGSAPSSPQQQLRWHQPSVTYYTTSQPAAMVPGSGMLILTDEEKRTLLTEGYPVPTRWPLSKQDEKNLKKVQRKIKNKMSAQESRRKKKDYVDSLEKQLEASNQENSQLKQRMDNLESDNRALMQKLHKLQSLANSVAPTSPPQASTCLMMFVLFFAVCIGVWGPASLSTHLSWRAPLAFIGPQTPVASTATAVASDQALSDYNTPSVKSRTLLFSADDADVSTSDTSSSCGYHNALLSWLTGSFSRSTRHQQSAAARVDVPRDVDNDNNGTEADGRLLVHDKTDDRITATAVEPVTTKEHNETWTTMSELMTASQSGIVSTELNVTYTATADVISVLE